MRITSWLALGLAAILGVGAAHAAAATAAPAEGKMLTFLDCQLPAEQYVATHFEKRADANQPWQSGNNKPQVFRSKVDREKRLVFWRKDNPDPAATFYGEIFTFDESTIYLHAETYPPRTNAEPLDGKWDERLDRFRCFTVSGAPDWSTGRAIAPIDGSLEWSHQGYIDTYICNSFEEYNQRTALNFQRHFYDNHVFIERIAPFSTVFDGTCEGWEADPEFQTFDEVLVINQCMENNVGRERFFVGRRGDLHYGIIRWDNSVMRDGKWVVIERCIGLKRGHSADGKPFSFAGMYERVKQDRQLK